MPKQIAIELADLDSIEPEIQDLLQRGSTFVRAVESVEAGDQFELVLVRAADAETMCLPAVVVSVVARGDPGAWLEIPDFSAQTREEIARFASGDEATGEEEHAGAGRSDRSPQNVHERLRGLSTADQIKIARDGDINERTVLERLYGKTVWEALLRNPRLTHPEVARIARMGALPKPQLEQIVSNPAWINSPQVRRALLSNRRLSGDMIQKVLRVAPKSELRLMPKQTAYPAPVREAARKLLKQLDPN